MKKGRAGRYPEIVTELYLSLLLLVFPLWIGPGGYLDVAETKYSFFQWATLIYIAVMLLLLAELMLIGKAREVIGRVRPIGPTRIFVLAYGFLCCISAALSQYPGEVWQGAGRHEGLGTILLYLAVFLFLSYFGRFKKRHLYLIGAVILINTVIGMLQYAGYNPFTLFPKGYTYHDAFVLYQNAFLGTLGNIDLLSAFLSLAIPLLYGYFILHEQESWLLLPYAAGIFLLFLSGVSAGVVGIGIGIFVTIPIAAKSKPGFGRALTAGGIAALAAATGKCMSATYVNRVTAVQFKMGAIPLALAAAAVLLLILSFLFKRFEKSIPWDDKKAGRILSGCVAAGIVAVPAVLWAYPFGSGTLASLHRLLHGEVDPKLGSSRIQIWQQVLKLVPERLWFGGGPDTLAKRLTFSFQRYNEATGTTIRAFIDTAHNDYLNILVNTGLLSLLAYLAALGSAAVRFLKKALSGKASLVLFIALLCYLIQIFFSFSICIVSPFFWAFFGLLESSIYEKSSEDVNLRV